VTFRKVEIDHFDAMLSHELGRAGKVPAFTNDNAFDPKLHCRSRTEVARHQCGIKRAASVTTEAARISQAIRLGVRHRIAILHSLIVPAACELPMLHKSRTNWDASLGQAKKRFVDGGLHKRV
jgi:hypothetical protein